MEICIELQYQTSKHIWTTVFFRYLLAAANKRTNDEKTLQYYAMDFSDFKNQWIEHQTNIPKSSGIPVFKSTIKEKLPNQ